jgi:hypothetical protein
MPFQPTPRPVAILASVLAAGLMLAVASCSHVTPLGPDPAATIPPTHALRSPLVLQAVSLQLSTQPGGCPSGSFASPGQPGQPVQCYRYTGKPVTVTSAAVSPVTSFQPPTPQGQQAVPVQYGFSITLPAADVAAVTAVIPAGPGTQGGLPVATSAAGAGGFALSVAGRTWVPIGFSTPSPTRQFSVFLAARNQAVQLQRALIPAG